jgi:hypothetical protein
MKGNVLYPLNTLRTLYPSTYERQVAKYQGRERLLERVIPIFDCLWNDVLHLCPLHPGLIFEKLREIGFDYPTRRFIEIHSDSLESENTLIMEYPVDSDERFYHRKGPNDFQSLDQLPSATVEYYKESFDKGINPLLFVYIPHVLYKGSIDIEGLKMIEV